MKKLALLMSMVFVLATVSLTFAFKDWVGAKPPSKAKTKQEQKAKYPVTKSKGKIKPTGKVLLGGP